MRRALLIDKRRIDSVFNQRRLMLDRFVNDGVEPMIGHDLEHAGHQSAARPKVSEQTLG